MLVGVLAAIGVVGGATWYLVADGDDSDHGDSTALMTTVSNGPFEHFVVERGDLESSNNEEIRCLVKATTGTGTAILKIVPAGKMVKQGDFLIQFDDSALKTQLTQQQIVVANAKATHTADFTLLATAKAALAEYDNGTSKQEQELARSEVFVAEENLRRAQEYFRFAERLAARSYITSVQLDAEQFSVQKATKDLDAARTKLDVLQKHTYAKMVAQLKGDIAKGEALQTASLATLNLETSRMEQMEDQIAKCRVVAPADGQVVYATQAERREEQTVIEEGAIIREGQTVIRLPDPSQMQVRALVNESRINLVRPGAAAKIELDSAPGVQLDGFVEAVDAFPMAKRWSSSTKEYGAIVKITTPSGNMRPGLRAKVTVFVAREPAALQVPVQAVVENDGMRYCLAMDSASGNWKPLPVVTGPNNDKFVVISEGLHEGDSVALDAQRYAEKITFPESPPSAKLAKRNEARGKHDGKSRAQSGG
jgi:multidrug resistance efflux pump